MTALVARLRAAGCVFAEEEARLLLRAATGAELERLVARRIAGEPLEHVLGWVAFAGLRVVVGPGVFVPRRRTELLVALARDGLAARGPRGEHGVVVELCAGVAAISAAVLASHPAAIVHAAEIDPVAVAVARRNLEPRGGVVHEGDLDAPLPADLRGRVDVLIADAPYVPTAELALLPPEARDHEPRAALDGGADGLDVARRIVAAAPGWLAPGGRLVIESSDRQAAALVAAMRDAGLAPHIAVDAALDATAVVGEV